MADERINETLSTGRTVFVMCLVTLVFATNCSYLTVQGPPPKKEWKNKPSEDCTGDVGAPSGDVILSALSAFVALAGIGSQAVDSSSESEFSGETGSTDASSSSDSSTGILIGGGLVVAAVSGLSAGYGFRETARCRDYRATVEELSLGVHAEDSSGENDSPESTKPGSESASPQTTLVAVMPIRDNSGKLTSDDLEAGTGYLRGGVASLEKFAVVSQGRQNEQLDKLLREQKKETYKECYDESCQIEVGKALSADTILRSHISYLDSCVLTIELIDLATETSFDANQARFTCGIKGLRRAIDSTLSQVKPPAPIR